MLCVLADAGEIARGCGLRALPRIALALPRTTPALPRRAPALCLPRRGQRLYRNTMSGKVKMLKMSVDTLMALQ